VVIVTAVIVEIEGITVLRTDAYRMTTGTELIDLLRARREMRTFIEDFDPDVVHGQDLSPMLRSYETVARKPVPVVITIHNVMTRLSPTDLHLWGRALRTADRVVGVSADVVDDTLTWAPWLGDRISVVPNGTPPPAFAGGPVGDGPAELLCIGRLVPQKGFDRALDALALVVKEHPDVHLTIAGVGAERAPLLERIADLGLVDHATLCGRVDHDRIGEMLAASTALVMPSRFEGLPLVALEAGWMSRPVIGTDVPGLRCAVADGVTGLLVAEDDTEALAAALSRVIEDRELARTLGARARRVAEQEWSLGTCADRYEALYRGLVG
jgi:glycosyltransferase involved in cell wall biosynthesis